MRSQRSILAAGALVLFSMLGAGAASAQTGLPWQSTFDSGNTSEWNGGFRNVNGGTVLSNGCVSGSCLRVPLLANTINDNYADFLFGDHQSRRGTKVEEVWLLMHSKFDAGYTWPNRSQKMAIINLTDGVTNDRHYQVYLYVTPSGVYQIDTSDIDNWQFFGHAQNMGSPVSVRFGQWDKLKLYVRLNTPGQANGILRLWINGVQKVERTNVDIRRGTSMGMNKLILSSGSTQGTGGNGYQWWDSFKLSQTDPESGPLPNAPSNVRVE